MGFTIAQKIIKNHLFSLLICVRNVTAHFILNINIIIKRKRNNSLITELFL